LDLCIPNSKFKDFLGTDGPRKFDKENDSENFSSLSPQKHAPLPQVSPVKSSMIAALSPSGQRSPSPKKHAPSPPQSTEKSKRQSWTKKSPTSPERPVYEGTPPSTPEEKRKRPITPPPSEQTTSESLSSPNNR